MGVIKIKLRRIETYFYIPEFISCKSLRKVKKRLNRKAVSKHGAGAVFKYNEMF